MLHSNASFSSKQELLETCSQPASPESSGPRSPTRTGTEDPTGTIVFTGASTLPGELYGVGRRPSVENPMDLNLIPTDKDQSCGWGSFTPKALQGFNSPRWVLFFLCVASFLQGMIVNGFINTIITSIERRFDLHSYQTGLIASSYDIAACICLAFVSYFGGTGHKPRWLGVGMLIMALGSLVFALPHFTTPPYNAGVSQSTGMCSRNQSSPCQDKEGGGLTIYRLVFMLGQFLHGVGATPLYTLGVTYLDENVKSNYAPVYIGIFYTAAILGPAVGYLLGGYFLNIYTEIHLTTDMTPEYPLWVGAWWIGFLVGGAGALLVALPILGYPRQLPGSQEFVAMRVCEAHQLRDGSHTTASDPQFGKSIKDMPRSMLLLLKNPTFIFLCLAGATDATLISGMSTFGPKFLESQFRLSAPEAATWFGYMVIPAGSGGTFLGGYIVKKLNMRCRVIVRFCTMCALVSLLSIFVFIIHCPNMLMAGVTAPYQFGLTEVQQLHQYQQLYDHPRKLRSRNSSSLEENLTAGCNAGCRCIREVYNPVCGADHMMYYSPCHAGCSSINHTEPSAGKQVYSGCSCVVANMSAGDEGFAVSGKCDSSCRHMSAFLIFFFITIFFTFISSIPALIATLRCVADSQRSFGLGIQWIVVRMLGSIPGPIVFGSVIDVSCLLWQDQCGEQGSCYLYQNSAMSQYMLMVGVIYKVLGTIFFLLAGVLYTPPPESPKVASSSYESTDRSIKDKSDLPVKDLPADGVIVNLHAR